MATIENNRPDTISNRKIRKLVRRKVSWKFSDEYLCHAMEGIYVLLESPPSPLQSDDAKTGQRTVDLHSFTVRQVRRTRQVRQPASPLVRRQRPGQTSFLLHGPDAE
jgi:hypothetical protein